MGSSDNENDLRLQNNCVCLASTFAWYY